MAAASVMAPPNPLIFWYFWSDTMVNLRPEEQRQEQKRSSITRSSITDSPVTAHSITHLPRCCSPAPAPGLAPACCPPCCSGRRSTGPVEASWPSQHCHSRWHCTHTPLSHGRSFCQHIYCFLEKKTQDTLDQSRTHLDNCVIVLCCVTC